MLQQHMVSGMRAAVHGLWRMRRSCSDSPQKEERGGKQRRHQHRVRCKGPQREESQRRLASPHCGSYAPRLGLAEALVPRVFPRRELIPGLAGELNNLSGLIGLFLQPVSSAARPQPVERGSSACPLLSSPSDSVGDAFRQAHHKKPLGKPLHSTAISAFRLGGLSFPGDISERDSPNSTHMNGLLVDTETIRTP